MTCDAITFHDAPRVDDGLYSALCVVLFAGMVVAVVAVALLWR